MSASSFMIARPWSSSIGCVTARVDIALAAGPLPDTTGLSVSFMTHERIVVALPTDHRLAGESSIDLADLAGEFRVVLRNRPQRTTHDRGVRMPGCGIHSSRGGQRRYRSRADGTPAPRACACPSLPIGCGCSARQESSSRRSPRDLPGSIGRIPPTSSEFRSSRSSATRTMNP